MDHPLPARDRIDYILNASPHRKLFIESGTADGYTANFMGDHFDQVFSIEIVRRTYNDAVIRFAEAPNVKIIYGDSAPFIARLLHRLDARPVTFWLDAHDNGELPSGAPSCPLMAELDAIFTYRWSGMVILVDDLHLFGTEGYPSLEEVTGYVHSLGLNYKTYVDNGILRIQ